jgi:hypothetical protein
MIEQNMLGLDADQGIDEHERLIGNNQIDVLEDEHHNGLMIDIPVHYDEEEFKEELGDDIHFQPMDILDEPLNEQVGIVNFAGLIPMFWGVLYWIRNTFGTLRDMILRALRRRAVDGNVVPIEGDNIDEAEEEICCICSQIRDAYVHCRHCDSVTHTAPICMSCADMMERCPRCRSEDGYEAPRIRRGLELPQGRRMVNGFVVQVGPVAENIANAAPLLVLPPAVIYDKDNIDTHNIYNVGKRKTKVNLIKDYIVINRRENCSDFFTCAEPDYVEDYSSYDIQQHLYLQQTTREVYVPRSLPHEVALRWIAGRDENNAEQALVVAATVENYCRDVDADAALIALWKQVIPNIANFNTRVLDRQTQAMTLYTASRRWKSAVTARIRIIYMALLPVLSLILVFLGGDLLQELTGSVVEQTNKLGIPPKIVGFVVGIIFEPVISELLKRFTISYDGSGVVLIVRQSLWVNFWYVLLFVRQLNLPPLMTIVAFIAQIALGMQPTVRAVVIHMLCNLMLVAFYGGYLHL